MDEPASPDTWTSPALGRMVTDVQSRLEAAVSPDELSPDELLATPPDASSRPHNLSQGGSVAGATPTAYYAAHSYVGSCC